MDNTLRAHLLDSGIASEDTIVPCTKQEIEYLQSHTAVSLPSEYISFLGTCGKCAGVLLHDCMFYYPEVLYTSRDLHETAECYAEEHLLPVSIFAFCARLADDYWYFAPAVSGSNLEVYHYVTGNGIPAQCVWRFSDFLYREIEACKQLTVDVNRIGSNSMLDRIRHDSIRRAAVVRELAVPPQWASFYKENR